MSEGEQAPYGSSGWPRDDRTRHPGAPGGPRHRDTMPGTVARHADQGHGDQGHGDQQYGDQHYDDVYANPYDDDQHHDDPHADRHDEGQHDDDPHADQHDGDQHDGDQHDDTYGAGQQEHRYPPYLVAVRSPDTVAGFLLIFAGMVTGISLLLRWVRDSDLTGWDLLRRGIEEAGVGAQQLFSSGFWQPVVVVLGGAGLLLLGLLLFVPARTHRFLGALALLVSLAVAAGVLVPLSEGGWNLALFEIGFWFALAVAVLGLLGALKSLASGPKHRPPGVR